ncbi:30S ribosomal protein S19 [archaeon]|nr:30S ribosomal protein S19 [archaeon]
MAKKVLFRGHEIEDLKAMSYDEFYDLLLSRQRRSLKRGLTPTKKKLLERVKKANNGENVKLRTHCRDMIVVPQMVDLTMEVHNGKEFIKVVIQPEMMGHYLGEFAPTRKRVQHGTPGMGATKSSLYIPLK